jgi:hypothetical protein
MGLYGDIRGMMEENRRLRDENEALMGKLETKAKMVFKEPF